MTLDQIADQLAGQGVADVRGRGKARFVYAKSPHGAIELSEQERGYWLEFWDPISDLPEKEEAFADVAIAVTEAKFWLAGERK